MKGVGGGGGGGKGGGEREGMGERRIPFVKINLSRLVID